MLTMSICYRAKIFNIALIKILIEIVEFQAKIYCHLRKKTAVGLF
jgi:hypothetical protein